MKVGLAIAGTALGLLASTSALAVDPPAAPRMTQLGAPDHAVSYVWNFVPADLAMDQHPYGGNIAEAWIYARVFTDSGKQYVLMRTVTDLKSNRVTLTADGKPDPRLKSEPVDAQRPVDARGLGFVGKGFDVRLSPNSIDWTDADGQIVFKGSGSPLAKVGTSSVIPYSKDGVSGVDMYTGQYQPITGTVYGEPVKGMFIIDHFVGRTRFGQAPLSNNEAVWFKFANVFEDGSVEMGEFFREVGDYRAAIVTDGTKVVAKSETPKVKFVFDAAGKVVKETWTVDGRQWELTPDNSGVKALGTSGLMQIWGGVRRIGDKRKIVNQFAIAEYNRSRLNKDEQ